MATIVIRSLRETSAEDLRKWLAARGEGRAWITEHPDTSPVVYIPPAIAEPALGAMLEDPIDARGLACCCARWTETCLLGKVPDAIQSSAEDCIGAFLEEKADEMP